MVDTITLVGVVISYLLGILSSKSYYIRFKNKLKEAATLVKDLKELLEALSSSLEDDTLTKEEIEKIKKEAMDIIEDIENLLR